MSFSVPISRYSAVNRGSRVSLNETRLLACEIGKMLDSGALDKEGRLSINPILKKIADALGVPKLRLDHFQEEKSQTIQKLARYLQLPVESICLSVRGHGTK